MSVLEGMPQATVNLNKRLGRDQAVTWSFFLESTRLMGRTFLSFSEAEPREPSLSHQPEP